MTFTFQLSLKESTQQERENKLKRHTRERGLSSHTREDYQILPQYYINNSILPVANYSKGLLGGENWLKEHWRFIQF